MVNPVSSSVSTYATPQPSFTNGADARVNTEQVQPRQAPAADTQKQEQKLGSRDEDRGTGTGSRREVSSGSNQNSPAQDANARRGELVDFSV